MRSESSEYLPKTSGFSQTIGESESIGGMLGGLIGSFFWHSEVWTQRNEALTEEVA